MIEKARSISPVSRISRISEVYRVVRKDTTASGNGKKFTIVLARAIEKLESTRGKERTIPR